jgi:hypothetical protein
MKPVDFRNETFADIQSRILGLLRLEIADPRWIQAMQAIKDSVRVQSTRTYLRFYRRLPDGSYAHIPSGV